ncbi:MAG: hypothetical protein HYY84_07905 [Deltaproteobacteria bacterium]|nr:hypothetical protein [Deltaproteobacteria bacterium]
MESFRARPGIANLALSLFAALGGLYILVYGSWKAVAADAPWSILIALLGAIVAVRNIVQLAAWRAVVTVSERGVELRGGLSRPKVAPLDDCSAMRSTTLMLMPAVEFVRDPSLDDLAPAAAPATPSKPARIRLLRVGFDLAAISDAIDRFRRKASRG